MDTDFQTASNPSPPALLPLISTLWICQLHPRINFTHTLHNSTQIGSPANQIRRIKSSQCKNSFARVALTDRIWKLSDKTLTWRETKRGAVASSGRTGWRTTGGYRSTTEKTKTTAASSRQHNCIVRPANGQRDPRRATSLRNRPPGPLPLRSFSFPVASHQLIGHAYVGRLRLPVDVPLLINLHMHRAEDNGGLDRSGSLRCRPSRSTRSHVCRRLKNQFGGVAKTLESLAWDVYQQACSSSRNLLIASDESSNIALQEEACIPNYLPS